MSDRRSDPERVGLRQALRSRDVKYLSDSLERHECLELVDYLTDPEAFPRSTAGSASRVSFRPKGALVFKEYRIRGFRDAWRAKAGREHPEHGLRFADAELHNYRRAAALELPVPSLKAVIGLDYRLSHARQLVVLQRLDGFTNLSYCLVNPSEVEAVLGRVAGLVFDLAEKGVLHFDLNAHNVMISACRCHVRLVDLERVRWNCAGRAKLAGYYFGYLYLHRLKKRLDLYPYRQFVKRALSQAFPDSAEYGEACEWFERSSATQFSRAEMYQLFL